MSQIFLSPPARLPHKTTWWYGEDYNKEEVDNFINQFKNPSIPKGSKLYIQRSGTLPQSKLRESGYKIKRKVEDADYIVIQTPPEKLMKVVHDGDRYKSYHPDKLDELFKEAYDLLITGKHKFVLDSDLYQKITNSTGDLKTYNDLKELLESSDRNNVKIGMELMTNCDWSNNEIYVLSLFTQNYSRIKYNQYFNSISFKSFVSTLPFDMNYVERSTHWTKPNYYKDYVKSDTHFQLVYDLYIEEFKKRLSQVCSEFSGLIDYTTVKIDKDILLKGSPIEE